MTINRIKILVTAVFVFTISAIVFFNTNPSGTIVSAADVAETYKTKCAMCHKANAEKSFDPSLSDEELVEIVLKGKKGEKPPFMPGFEAKGMTNDEAKALVDYMRKLRNPDGDDKAQSPKEEAKAETDEKAREAIVAMYKSKCAACHSPNAEKHFDPEMKPEELAQIILKGKKGEKPPFMPAYESKGVTEKQAAALAAYMIELRTPAKE